MRLVSSINVAWRLTIGLSALGVLFGLGLPSEAAGAFLAIAQFTTELGIAATLGVYLARMPPRDVPKSRQGGREVLRLSVPYAANSFFNYAYNKGDILFVTASTASAVEVARYGPASQIKTSLQRSPAC